MFIMPYVKHSFFWSDSTNNYPFRFLVEDEADTHVWAYKTVTSTSDAPNSPHCNSKDCFNKPNIKSNVLLKFVKIIVNKINKILKG